MASNTIIAPSPHGAYGLDYNNTFDFKHRGVTWFDGSLTAGAAVKVNDSPTSAWWHILRFNHQNTNEYYTDLAIPFNDRSIYWKRITANAVQNGGWVRVLDVNNISDNVYWANIKVSTSSNAATEPTCSRITLSYKSGTWVNSLTNAAVTLTDAASSYGGWICGPTKDGRIAISTYQASDNYLYFGYGERGRTANSFATQIRWDGPNNILYGARSDWNWLRVINNASNNSDDAMVYLQNQSNNDWAMKINCTGYDYGLQIIGAASASNALHVTGSSQLIGKVYIQQPATARNNGIIGTYDYTKAAAIWSMGNSYQIATDGSGLGNLYGAAYGYAGQAYLGSNNYAGGHQFLWCENGTVYVALGDHIWARNNITAGTDITAGRYVYNSYTHQSCGVENGTITNIIYDNGDGWLRKASYAHLCNNLQGTFLRYNGWWTSGSGQNVDNAHGMIFAYSNHGLPGSWGIVTTFDYQNDSAYRHQIYGDGYNSEMYFRVRSSDRGGWYGGWKRLIYDGTGHAYIGSYNNTSYALSTSSLICQSWIRTTGSTGWYNESYGGGWYMTDSTYVRVYNNKRVYNANNERYAFYTEGGFASGGGRAEVFNIYYNGTWYDCLHNHQNGNLSVDGPGGSLYLSYYRGNTYFGGGTYYIDRAGYFNGRCASANSATSATYLAIDNTANRASCLQFMQRSDGVDSPSATWYQIIKMNHGTGDSYYKRTLAFEFWSHNMWTTYASGNGANNTWKRVWVEGNSVTSAVWNDYAECRQSHCEEFGYVVYELGDDTVDKTTERLQHFAGITSDTWGFSQGETEKAKTPIAVAGRVLAYTYRPRGEYKPGDCVCAAPGGTVDIMTREEVLQYPDRIVGTVSCVPDYETWGGGEFDYRDSIKVNGRIWIKVR